MDIFSPEDDFDINSDTEKTLLGEDMTIDSPKKSVRKPIVFDIDGRNTPEDDEENEEMRDKFRSERTELSAPQRLTTKREIPDSLREVIESNPQLMKFQTKNSLKRLRKRERRLERNGFISGYHMNYGQNPRHGFNQYNQRQDLRQIINNERNYHKFNYNYRQPMIDSNLILQNQAMNSLPPLLNWQLGLGIVNQNTVQTTLQTQLMSALLGQSTANPLLNRLQQLVPSVSEPLPKKPKEDIKITIINNKNRSTNTTITKTKFQIRCLANIDSSDSTDCEVIDIEGMPSMPKPTDLSKPKLTTMFSKHLATKANQSKAKSMESIGSSGDGFGDALAEAEVGVDNQYLQRMKEMERKRKEILQQKEKRRLEMADQRLQTAEELQQKISNRRHISYN